jgi:hypothetical protein
MDPESPKLEVVKFKTIDESWRFGRFLKKMALGGLFGLLIGLLAVYFTEAQVFEALNSLFFAPKLNAVVFDDNEAYISELRKSVDGYKLGYKEKRSLCLIFSQEDVLAGNFSYLRGCWDSRANKFLNSFTGKEASFEFCFRDATNKVEFMVSEPGSTEVCRAPGEVTYQAGNLIVTASAVAACPGTGADSYPKYDLKCAYSPQGTQATCNLIQHDEYNSVFPIEFRKKSLNNASKN